MKNSRNKLKIGLLVMAVLLAALFLTGVTNIDGPNQVGRYRLIVIDTATGIVKWVGNDEGKPFEEIKGR
jgi:hypothetical protein